MYYKNFFLHVVCSQETAMAPSTRSGTVAKTSGSARKRTIDSLRVRLTAQQIMRLAPQHSTRPPQPLTSQQLLTPQQPSTDSESFQQICKGARPKPVTVEEVATNNNFTALPSPPPPTPQETTMVTTQRTSTHCFNIPPIVAKIQGQYHISIREIWKL